MSGLKMPAKGKAALLLSELNAEDAPRPATTEATNATPFQRSTEAANEGSNARSDEREERLARAIQFSAEDEIAVVTVRVPSRLNEYMDRYVERINRLTPKRRYRKQDAVAEAFAAFFADHPMPPAPADQEL